MLPRHSVRLNLQWFAIHLGSLHMSLSEWMLMFNKMPLDIPMAGMQECINIDLLSMTQDFVFMSVFFFYQPRTQTSVHFHQKMKLLAHMDQFGFTTINSRPQNSLSLMIKKP